MSAAYPANDPDDLGVEIARLAGLLAHERGADGALTVLTNVMAALRPMSKMGKVMLSRTQTMQVVMSVAEKHRVTQAEIFGPSRSKRISWPRQEAYAVLFDTGRFSTPAIGRLFGGRDHSTIVHGIKAHRARQVASCPA